MYVYMHEYVEVFVSDWLKNHFLNISSNFASLDARVSAGLDDTVAVLAQVTKALAKAEEELDDEPLPEALKKELLSLEPVPAFVGAGPSQMEAFKNSAW